MKRILLAAIALTAIALASESASAGGLITEFGGGIKLNTTSFPMLPECKKVVVVDPANNPRHADPFSCGGDDPIFIGWPIAWEFDNGTKLGWFHYSHWFDGRGELHLDCVCASWTKRWHRRKR